MHLDFKSISITKFKSFSGKPQDLVFSEFPIGVCFLRGLNKFQPAISPNGSGKTSIWDALCWCLMGKTPDGLRNPDVRSWGTAKQTVVMVCVAVDNVPHTIARTIKPNSLRIDGKVVTQEQVDALLRINYEMFVHTILLGQSQPLFFDLKPSEKLQLLSDALDLNRWDDRAQLALAKAQQLNYAHGVIERDLSSVSARLDQTEDMYATAKEKAKSWDRDRSEKLEALEEKLSEYVKVADHLKMELGSAEVLEDGALTEYNALNSAFRAAYDILFELRDSMTRTSEQVKQREARIREFRRELSDLGSTDVCPTCGQSIMGTELEMHKAEIKKRCRKLEKQVAELDLPSVEAEYQKQEAVIDRMRPDIEAKEQIAKKAKSSIEFWRTQLSEAQVNVRSQKERIVESNNQDNPYREQMTSLRNQRAEFIKDKKELQGQLSTIEKRIERTRFWVKGFKDVRLYILSEILTELELATNSMLESVGLFDWSVQYAIEKETKSGTVKRGLVATIQSPLNTEPVRWECWSGGEGQRLRLIGSLALSEVLLSHVGVIPNLEILDEPTQHLSEGGIYDLCTFLGERAKVLDRQIWYTDHQSVDSTLFAAMATAVKTAKGRSEIRT